MQCFWQAVYLGMVMLDYRGMIHIFRCIRCCLTAFKSGFVFYPSSGSTQVCLSFSLLVLTFIEIFENFPQLVDVKWYAIGILCCISLFTKEGRHLFVSFLGIWVFYSFIQFFFCVPLLGSFFFFTFSQVYLLLTL